MTNINDIAPIEELKAQARRLRERLRAAGTDLSHGQALDLLAQQHGLRDWNTLHARAGNRMHLRVGDRVRGTYLGQPFTGEIRALTALADGEYRRVTLHFDEAVDVVTFDSFSSFRQRVNATVGWDGRSPQKTSDGRPHLVLMPEGA